MSNGRLQIETAQVHDDDDDDAVDGYGAMDDCLLFANKRVINRSGGEGHALLLIWHLGD